MSGSMQNGGSGGGSSISPAAINQAQNFIAANTTMQDPSQVLPYQRPGIGGPTAIPIDQSNGPAVGMQHPLQVPQADGPHASSGIPPAMANSAGGGALTSGLGAGDAASAAAQASGSTLPGATSSAALAQMMSGIGNANKAAIQQKIDMLKMIAGG